MLVCCMTYPTVIWTTLSSGNTSKSCFLTPRQKSGNLLAEVGKGLFNFLLVCWLVFCLVVVVFMKYKIKSETVQKFTPWEWK